MIPLIWSNQNSENHKDRKYNYSWQGLGENGKLLASGHRASVLQAEKNYGMDGGDGWTRM